MTQKQYPLVFIRGLLRSQGHWGEFRHMVTAMFPQRQCLFLDIPGNGELYSLTSPSNIRQMTLALISQLKALQLTDNKIDLVSVSMGGMIALDWAHYAPKQINSLLLVNTSLKNFSPFYQRLQPKSWWLLLAMLFSTRQYKEACIYRLTSNVSFTVKQFNKQAKKAHKKQTLAQWLVLAEHQPVKMINGLRQLWAAATFQQAEKPPVAITLCNSLNDHLVAAKCSEQIAKAWQLKLITHPWAGHDIALDDPQWLCQKLGELSINS